MCPRRTTAPLQISKEPTPLERHTPLSSKRLQKKTIKNIRCQDTNITNIQNIKLQKPSGAHWKACGACLGGPAKGSPLCAVTRQSCPEPYKTTWSSSQERPSDENKSATSTWTKRTLQAGWHKKLVSRHGLQMHGQSNPYSFRCWVQGAACKVKFSKSKSVLPKMSARSGLVGKNPPGPIWAHLGPFFAWAGKIEKMQKMFIFLGGPYSRGLEFKLHCMIV